MIVIQGELYSSKNSRQVFKVKGRTIVAKSKVSKAQEGSHAIQLKIYKRQWMDMIDGKEFPLLVRFNIYRKTAGRFDWMNVVHGLIDSMVKAGYMPDDSAEFFKPVFGEYAKDAKNPRTEIEVL